jgi:energy-coupling factor transporter ATP-binding protein EcfA2
MINSDSRGPKIDLNLDDIDLKASPSSPDTTEQVNMENSGPYDMESNDLEIDENDIVIQDKKAPIVMLFGPRSSGKSMTLVRLSRYLRDQNYTVIVDEMFKSDAKYKEKCEEFARHLNTTKALPGNAYTDFLLIKVVKNGKTLCQILEAPGEHYFDPDNVKSSNFPPYMTEMISSLHNRKIWAFLTEAKWNVSHSVRRAYVERIRNCMHMLVRNTDRFAILYNKIDQREELFHEGKILLKPAEETMKSEYEGLANIFKNTNPITSLWRSYNYKFVPFCTGYYTMDRGELRYTKSDDMYPRLLWEALLSCIRG